MSVLTRLRRFWLNVHLWVGVALFIPFALLGLTGSALVWQGALDRQLQPAHYAVSAGAPVALATDLANARTALGEDFVVTALRLPEHAGDPLIAQARAKGRPAPGARPVQRNVWLDPASGRVLGAGVNREALLGAAHALHGQLMLPENGRFVVGVLGVGMLISALTGIWLWWPRGAFFAGFLWKRGPRTTYNLHHFVGFWLAIPLAILAATGAYISFPQTSRALTAMFVETRAPEQRGPGGGGPGGGPGGGAPPLSETHLSIDDAAHAAIAATPGARLVSITLPTRGREQRAPSWRLQVQTAGAEAMSTISVDDETGAARTSGRAPSPGENVARLMRRVHDGDDLSFIWRVIITLAGVAPAILGVTGVIIWLRRRAARRAIRRGETAAHAMDAAATK